MLQKSLIPTPNRILGWIGLSMAALLSLTACATRSQTSFVDLPVMANDTEVISQAEFVLYVQSVNQSIAANRLERLFSIYKTETADEGVSLLVALSQMILETDFLRYTGSVDASQFNFAGIGAVNDHTAGVAFVNEAIGARAQIQHLKAYASTDPLKKPLVDPRFRYVKRGSAPTVLALSRRWAADPNYGIKILRHARALLLIQSGP